MTADDNDIGYTSGRTVTFESLGQGAVISGFIALVLAILPLPVPTLTLLLSLGACALGAYVLKRGAAYGGITAAFGLVGTVLAVFAVPIAGYSVATAPEPPPEAVTTPPPDTEGTVPEETPPAEPTPEETVEPSPTPSSTPETVQLVVASVTATSTADSAQDAAGNTVTFDAGNVIDNDPGTAWRTPGAGTGESLTFTFGRPVHLTSVGVIPGYAKLDPTSGVNRFTENRRVKQARFDFGTGTVTDYAFADSTQSQTYTIDVITDSVTVTILESTAKTKRNFTALSEITFSGWVD